MKRPNYENNDPNEVKFYHMSPTKQKILIRYQIVNR